MKIYRDKFGNRAEIDMSIRPAYICGAPEEMWRLSCYAEYNDDYLYHVSVHESQQQALKQMNEFSCGSWEEITKGISEPEPTYYENPDTGELMTYDEMVEYCRENFDYGDPTNYVTYMSNWWEEYEFRKVR